MMAFVPSITYWNRVEPSPRDDTVQPGLTAAVRDPLWFLTRQWQLGEFAGEDAGSPAYTSLTSRSSTFDSWQTGDGPAQPYDGTVPLEAAVETEATTPDLRLAAEIGQILEQRLRTAGLGQDTVDALRSSYPVPRPDQLSVADARDPALVRLLRVCGGRTVDGLAALRGGVAGVALPAGAAGPVAQVLADLASWVRDVYGVIGETDAPSWRADRLEYACAVTTPVGGGAHITMQAYAGLNGEFDWYAFDETRRERPRDAVPDDGASVTTSLLPMPVRFAGMPDPRWWNFEDARFNWSNVDTDRRDLAKVLVIDFMLVQGTDWFVVPFGHEVGSIVRLDQVLVRDVFGEVTLVRSANGPSWSMFSTSTSDGVA